MSAETNGDGLRFDIGKVTFPPLRFTAKTKKAERSTFPAQTHFFGAVMEFQTPLLTRRDTRKLGQNLAQVLQAGDLVILEGDLGAGKTFLVRAIARSLEVPTWVPITSPTFELVHELPGIIPILHVDLYRLEDAEQLIELGLDERIGGDALVLVEWGERFARYLGNSGLFIYLLFNSHGQRFVKIVSQGSRANQSLQQLSKRIRQIHG